VRCFHECAGVGRRLCDGAEFFVCQLFAVAKSDLELLVAPGLSFGGQGQRLVGSPILGELIQGLGLRACAWVKKAAEIISRCGVYFLIFAAAFGLGDFLSILTFQ